MARPTVGRIVHYQAHGSPDGTHASEPRAAIVTRVVYDSDEYSVVDLMVCNPGGLFFNLACKQNEEEHKGGTWHWPPKV